MKEIGLYFHIPFCKQACHYCDFYFSTSLRQKQRVLNALHRELELRAAAWSGVQLRSIYFGGGTPSLLTANEINELMASAKSAFSLLPTAEITLEANPDDLSPAYLQGLSKTEINRLSIGVQSFFDEDLQWMNRAHSADEAVNCLKALQQVGFTNFTIDLIYGFPQLTSNRWLSNLEELLRFNVPHFSAYSLTVEPGTALHNTIQRGALPPVDEQLAAEHLAQLQTFALQNNYDHYEVSNFAQPGKQAVHNSGYWFGIPYLGIGPSAHGFTGSYRYSNRANNRKYYESIEAGELPERLEFLSEAERFNEWCMLGLRTSQGLNLEHLKAFDNIYQMHFQSTCADEFVKQHTQLEHNWLRLTPSGMHYADRIAAEFFLVEE